MTHTTRTTPPKRPAKDSAKSIVMKALKPLSLKERVEVMAAALASMGLPMFAGMLREASQDTLAEEGRAYTEPHNINT